MNLTFIIGNGFDLKLGMKTRYTDVYESYIKSKSKSETIEKFKANLESDYEKWSDFEIGMAKYARNFNSEDELIECVRDFRSHMTEQLSRENDIIKKKIYDYNDIIEILDETKRSLYSFYEGLIPNAKYEIKQLMNKTPTTINFIVFNYTQTLDQILYSCARTGYQTGNKPIHIHGELGNDVALGVDDVAQLEYPPYNITKRGKRTFVKPLYNLDFDKQRVDAAANVISKSDIICVYGFAFGETDETWVKSIADWLRSSPEKQLVVFQYDEKVYNINNRDELMDVEDDKRNELLKRLGFNSLEYDKVEGQVHIPIGADIFNYGFLTKSDADSKELVQA